MSGILSSNVSVSTPMPKNQAGEMRRARLDLDRAESFARKGIGDGDGFDDLNYCLRGIF